MKIASEVLGHLRLPIIIGVFILVVLFACSNWTKQNIAESHRRGDKIVAAIEKYYVERHKYPARLEDLVPTYLSKIEPPVAGNGRWIYTDNGGSGYFLGFGGDSADLDPIAYRADDLREWVIDTR